MTVYLVVYQAEYEGGEVYGVYSTRAAAENSWHMKYEQYNEIQEFELDLDPKADEGDPGVRHGPLTEYQFKINQMLDRTIITNLRVPTAFMTKRSLPERTGKTIQFFRTDGK